MVPDFLFQPEAGSDALVVVFTSYGEEGVPFRDFELRSTLTEVRANKLFLRDSSRRWYQGPLPGFSRSREETALGIRAFGRGSGASRVMTVGICMGGYAALYFGAVLGVEEVLAISPNTNITVDFWAAVADERARADLCATQLIPHEADLRKFFEQGRTPHRTNIVSDDFLSDGPSARNMLGLPGVEVEWRTGAHHVAYDMVKAGEVARRVQHFVMRGARCDDPARPPWSPAPSHTATPPPPG